MESRIFLIKNVKDPEKTKKGILDKIRTMVSADANIVGDMLSVQKKDTWAESKATINFTKKDKDLEVTLQTSHSATTTTMLVGCVLVLLTLLLVVVPWYLYEQDKKRFSESIVNVLNYAASAG